MAASTIEVTPVPVPTTKPHSRISCHSLRIWVVRPTPTANSPSAPRMTRRSPHRSMTDAANGPMSPKSAMLMAMAEEMTVRLQPNSLSSGIMRMPAVERMPAVTRRTAKVTRATTHA